MDVSVAQQWAGRFVVGLALGVLVTGCSPVSPTVPNNNSEQMDQLSRAEEESASQQMAAASPAELQPLTEQSLSAQSLAASSGLSIEDTSPKAMLAPQAEGVSSRILTNAQEGSIGLELIEGQKFNRLVIAGAGETSDYKVSRLNAPSRVVIDIKNQKNRLNRVFDTQDSEFISSIRVGAHPDKSRIVIDLAQEKDLVHNVDVIGNDLVITLARGADIDNVMSAENIPTASSPLLEAHAALKPVNASDSTTSAKPIAPALLEPESPLAVEANPDQLLKPVIPNEDRSDKIAEKAAIDAKTAAAAKTESLTPLLKSVQIEALGEGQNMIIADMESAGFFSLKRSAPSEYVLTLEKATLAPTAGETKLAPAGSGLIRSVRPLVDGQNVVLRIFSDPKAQLDARASGGKIVVSAVESALGQDARAQFDPKTPAEKDAASEGAKTTGSSNGGSNLAANGSTNATSENDLAALFQDTPKYTGRLISLDLQDTDIDNALRIIAEVSNLNIIASEDVTGKVTLRLIDVPWDQALDVILKTNGLDKVQEGNVIRIAPVEKLRQERETLKQAQQAEEELEPLQVRYIRVSYAKASEMQPLVENVITERGTVSYDERTNQLIVKDIGRGIKNVAVLVSKLDLRTPQVLLETQIVEASRSLSRDLGSELGFEYIQSPATGNATGNNFPNAIAIGGSAVGPNNNTGSSFPAAITG